MDPLERRVAELEIALGQRDTSARSVTVPSRLEKVSAITSLAGIAHERHNPVQRPVTAPVEPGFFDLEMERGYLAVSRVSN